MSSWAYVAIAYTAVWGALAVYAVVLARRVTQARAIERTLRDATAAHVARQETDTALCDVPPAP